MFNVLKNVEILCHIHIYMYMYICVCISAGSIPGFVRYRSIPEFCSILDTYVVSLIFR